ncbi:hypothetical protein BH20ACT15_BH20ACT15_13720 [soil metagenome]
MSKGSIALLAALALVPASSAWAQAPERGDPAEPDAAAELAPSPRVVGGQSASTATYPWQAAVVLDESFNQNDFNGQFCGGSLIAPRIVITAGHCVVDTDPDCSPAVTACLQDFAGGDGTNKLDFNDANVVLGRDVLSSGAGEEIDLKAVYLGNGYSDASGVPVNDAAYLVLASPSSQTPVKLAGPDETPLWAPGVPNEISGWGATSQGGSRSDQLRAATVGIISDSTCGSAQVYGLTFKASSMVCAGYLSGGVDTCQGDSGGPLQAPAEAPGGAAIYRLVGISSWGSGCAQPNAPGVYARVCGGSPLHGTVVSHVAAIESAESLAPTSIVGSGAQPRTGGGGGSGTGGSGGGGTTDNTPTTLAPTARCAGKVATIVGTPGRDTLRGTPKRDVIAGLGGKDTLVGRGGNDIICGNGGHNRIFGGPGNDRLIGGPRSDRMAGGQGRDVLIGRGGNDLLSGGPGPDKLKAGKGRNDRCKGGGGKDKGKGCEKGNV